MKNKNKNVSVGTLWKWVFTVAWALTFAFLFVFIGIVSGFTKTAKKTTQGHWTFKSTVKATDSAKDVTVDIKAIDFPGISSDAKTVMENKVDLDRPKFNSSKVEAFKKAKAAFEKAQGDAKKAYDKDETAANKKLKAEKQKIHVKYNEAAQAAKKINVKIDSKHIKAYDEGMMKANKDFAGEIKTAKDNYKSAIEKAQKTYRPEFLKAFLWKNTEQEGGTWVKPDSTHVYNKELADVFSWDSKWSVDKYENGKATQEAKRASNYIAGFALGFTSLLATSIFSTAIIKYSLKGGNK